MALWQVRPAYVGWYLSNKWGHREDVNDGCAMAQIVLGNGWPVHDDALVPAMHHHEAHLQSASDPAKQLQGAPEHCLKALT